MFSRAFLNFNSPEAVYDFKARFDGHVFVSTRGTQYRCSVEYAPFQKVPTAHPKKLAMEGTIDKGALNDVTLPSLPFSRKLMLLGRLVLFETAHRLQQAMAAATSPALLQCLLANAATPA
jgi:hypothetical protein